MNRQLDMQASRELFPLSHLSVSAGIQSAGTLSWKCSAILARHILPAQRKDLRPDRRTTKPIRTMSRETAFTVLRQMGMACLRASQESFVTEDSDDSVATGSKCLFTYVLVLKQKN